MKYENDKFKNYNLGSLAEEPVKELETLSKAAACEGIVLIKNSKGTLPYKKGDAVSAFGRIQREYYKSGTGSGGLVNVKYKTNIVDSLRNGGVVDINEELASFYNSFVSEHPFEKGNGWGQEPWCQEEAEIEDETVKKAAQVSEKALIIIGRTAGEDKDNSNTEGSYLLAEKERRLIAKVCRYFEKVTVVLNVGNIMDMTWAEEYGVDSVLYVWQGGQCGGEAAADILCEKETPCGKLSDTIAYSIDDYPSTANFGDPIENRYTEDIYVGYRYFETFAKDRVLYPFGFGLSYTDFEIKTDASESDGMITVKTAVTNVGEYDGKEVVQAYFEAPQGKLGKPARQLIGFEKTKLLKKGDTCIVKICLNVADMASYDDSGTSGHKNCYVLENGDYNIYVGTDVRSAKKVLTYTVKETYVTKFCTECLTPTIPFERLKPNENFEKIYEPVPQRTYSVSDRINKNLPKEIPYTGDKNIKLGDVRTGKHTIEEFVAQLNDDELSCIVRGEGMNSPKVTAGTGCCFGGVTDELLHYGIPEVCGTDGPSGIRMDSGMLATSMPNGTCLACTFNRELVKELYEYEGVEMTAYKIDVLLGPGINIHRNPLNGRNFEYFSEDPYLTGEMAASVSNGLGGAGVYCVIKHFAVNNQEYKRHDNNSVLSERAMREIYALPFEIAIRKGGAKSVMTSYNFVNGEHAATCYDLTTTLLRGDFAFDGFVMTDWWAKTNSLDGTVSTNDTASMVKAQNDAFMVVPDAKTYADTIKDSLASGYLKRAELQRCAANICRFVMNTHAFERFKANGYKSVKEKTDTSKMTKIFEVVNVEMGKKVPISVENSGKCAIKIDVVSDDGELAQITTKAIINGNGACAFVTKGTSGEKTSAVASLYLEKGITEISFETSSKSLKISGLSIYR